MRQRLLVWALVALGIIRTAPAPAQTQINPDISAIGDMRYVFRDDVARDLAGQKDASFEFEELELVLAGYLNPYARGDVFLAIHGVTGPAELEEVYATLLRGLPFQAKFGKYLLDFGRINRLHRHQFSWLRLPLIHRSFFSEEGANAIGIQLERLQPIGDMALSLSGSAFRSDFFEGDEGVAENGEHGHAAEGEADIGLCGRASFFRSLTDVHHLEIGGSYLYGSHDTERKLDTQVAGVDVKYKWRPDAYRGLVIMAESMLSDREVRADSVGPVTTETAVGVFTSAEFRFRKQYDVGAYYDWAQDPHDSDFETAGYGGWFAFMPVEETIRFSIVYRHGESDLYDGSTDEVTVQVLFALGPHKPHPF